MILSWVLLDRANSVTVCGVQWSSLVGLDDKGNVKHVPREFEGSLNSGAQGWVASTEV